MSWNPAQMARTTEPLPAFRATPPRIEQGAEIVEAVGRHQSRRRQFPESVFDFRGQVPGPFGKVPEETCAALLQMSVKILGDGAQLQLPFNRRVPVRFTENRQQPGRILPRKNADRRHARRGDARTRHPFPLHRFLIQPGMRREAAPRDGPAQAQPIQQRGIILSHPRRQDGTFPGGRRRLEAGQLANDRFESLIAVQARAGRDMLPLEEKHHELRRGHRLDVLAEPADRQTVDTRQQAAIAPLHRFQC